MKMKMLGAALAGLMLSAGVASAGYPDRPVRLIVPFAAGGVTDVAARLLGQQLSVKWGQPVVVENRPGAGGLIGVDQVIKSPADGYTILAGTNGEFVVHQAASKKPRFAPSDLVPIAMATVTAYAIAANNESGIKSLKDLVERAKTKPDALSFPSAGVGTTMHMAIEQFAAAAGVKMLHIPYKGGAPAATALTTGEVPFGFVSLNAIDPVKDSGKATVLAVTSKSRVPSMPDVPTVEETGVLKGYEAVVWTALFVPKGTPDDIVTKIRADVAEAMKDPALLKRLAQIGTLPGTVAGAELAAQIQRETDELSKTAKAAGISLD